LNLLTTDNPMIVNVLIANRFKATPASNLSAILETVSALDVWFAELMKNHFFLGDPFDVDFFCRGLEMIIQFDHHIALAKLLQMLYNYSDLFVGRNRLVIFGDLILDKYFFNLFLHWDDNVRMMFIQLFIFKMLRSKRRVLRDTTNSAIDDEEDANNKYSPRAVYLILLEKIDAYMSSVSQTLEQMKLNNPSVLLGARAATRSSSASGGIPTWSVRRGFDNSVPIAVPPINEMRGTRPKKRYVTEDGVPVETTTDETKPEINDKETESKTEEKPDSNEPTEDGKESATSTPSGPNETTDDSTAEKAAETSEQNGSIIPIVPEDKIIYLERSYSLFVRHMARYQEWQNKINAPVPSLVFLSQ